MSPKTVGKRKRKRNPMPSSLELIMRSPTLGLPIALMMSSIVDRLLAHRTPILVEYANVAAMERARGLLNTAPLSAEQASQESISRARNTP